MDLLGAIRRSWWALVVLGLAGLVVGALLPVSRHNEPPTGRSTLTWQARTVVGTAPTGGGDQVAGDVTEAQIQFYGTTVALEKATATAVGLDVPASRYPSFFSAVVVPDGRGRGASGTGESSSSTVVLTARGRTKAQATALAAEYAEQLGDYLAFLATVSARAKAGPGGAVTAPTGYLVLQTARATPVTGTPGGSTGTRWVRGSAGLLIGLALGVIVALGRERLDGRLRRADRTQAAFGFPIVVEIPVAPPLTPSAPGRHPMVDVVRSPDSPAAEAYRMLRMSLLFEPVPGTQARGSPPIGSVRSSAGREAGEYTGTGPPAAPMTQAGGPRGEEAHPTRNSTGEPADRAATRVTADPVQATVVLVASAGNEPTRAYVAANLAAAYGEAGEKVVVVSTWDIEAGGNGAQATEAPGADRIRGQDVQARMEPSRLDRVYRLSLSPFLAGSAQLVSRGGRVLDAARSVCDVVIVEVPPLLALHHAEALSHSVDVVLVVGECGYTTRDDARRSAALLRRIGAPVLGVVFTNVPLHSADIRQTTPRHRPGAPPVAGATDDETVSEGVGAGRAPNPATPDAELGFPVTS